MLEYCHENSGIVGVQTQKGGGGGGGGGDGVNSGIFLYFKKKLSQHSENIQRRNVH